MKHLLVLFTLWSAQGFAQNVCSSVWVYKPYLTCDAGAGPDLKAGGVNVSRYPIVTAAPAPECGTELKWQAQSLAMGVPANSEVRCMSCDRLDSAPDMNQLVSCLYANISEVIEARDTQFSAADLAPMKAKIKALLDIHQSSPIDSLNQFNIRSAFEKYKN